MLSVAQCPDYSKSSVLNYRRATTIVNGWVQVFNPFDVPVNALLYHSDNPASSFTTYTIAPGVRTMLQWEGQHITLANDWGIQLQFPDNQKTCIFFIGSAGSFADRTYVIDFRNMNWNNPGGPLRIQETNSFTDPRDGKTYKTIRLGNQVWMAQNLNYAFQGGYIDAEKVFVRDGSWCYHTSNDCKESGRFYGWYAAKQVCPSGWHLPSVMEWFDLISFTGGKPAMMDQLTRDGFNLTFAGYVTLKQADPVNYLERTATAKVKDVKEHLNENSAALFWSSDPYTQPNTWSYLHLVRGKPEFTNIYYSGDGGFSVRCVKD
ncbi:MAG: hypothetical protein JXA23_06020 [Bacteroidales bacterium]|nr:hypothetical protein [Bacteroidales bacterium]